MRVQDVVDTLDLETGVPGCGQAHVRHRSRVLSDNGPGYIAVDDIDSVCGAPLQLQTQSKIKAFPILCCGRRTPICLFARPVRQMPLSDIRQNSGQGHLATYPGALCPC
jgi:hypothetical protein